MAYDKDGKNEDLLGKLQKQGCKVAREFAFTRDFESSFPPEMLAKALNEYAEEVAKSTLRLSVAEVEDLLHDPKPFALALKTRYNMELAKPRFAWILGVLMSRDLEERGRWNEVFNTTPPKDAFNYEAYHFLKFIMS